MNTLEIAVVSDLHAYQPETSDRPKEPPSYLDVSLPEDQPSQHPIAGLKALIKAEELSSDVLLCPGDIGDKAFPVAVKFGWKWVQEIATGLNAGFVAATTGNHDCDSRFAYNKYDAKGTLQALDPPYPLRDAGDNDKYWARNFIMIDSDPRYRLLVLNSSAYHGYQDESAHGRLADSTLDQIKQQLTTTDSKPANILLCHHHPQPHIELDLGAEDIMTNGPLLLAALETTRSGPWLVVHGHKHHPKLSYASGGGLSPVVFAAGSLAAILKGKVASSPARNQFYIVSLPLDKFDQFGLVGTIRSWEWHSGIGWTKARPKSQLPYCCGFGCRDPIQLAKRVAALVGPEKLDWARVRIQEPQVDFLLPQDATVMIEQLASRHNIGVVYDEHGVPKEIANLL